jgi:hypothetical protein
VFFGAAHNGWRDAGGFVCPRFRSRPTVRGHEIDERRADRFVDVLLNWPGKEFRVLGRECDKDESWPELWDAVVGGLEDSAFGLVSQPCEFGAEFVAVVSEFFGGESRNVLK